MISSIYIGLLGLILFKISLETIKGRRKHQISLGPGDEDQIQAVVSAHSNFVAYAPFLAIMLFLHDSYFPIPKLIIHLVGIVTVLGRWFHFQAMISPKMNFKMRVLSMHMTL
jgi:uncharacterized membrane protein YecN with MAPEG domain